MHQNHKYGKIDSGVTMSLEVNQYAERGDVVEVHTGVIGYCLTGPGEGQGNSGNYASVVLCPVGRVVALKVSGAEGAAVYGHQTGTNAVTYDTTPANGWPVGYIVKPQGGDQLPAGYQLVSLVAQPAYDS